MKQLEAVARNFGQATRPAEPKMLGLFRSDFFMAAGLTTLVVACFVIVGFRLIERRKITRLAPHDYSNIPRDQRVFYELISDAIMSLRQRVGDKALDIAQATDGLIIDEQTGRVVAITNSPSRVIAELVSGYERILGKKVSFAFRQDSKHKPSAAS